MIEEVGIRGEKIAEIITRPVTASYTDEVVIDSFLQKCAKCWEHITRCEVTCGAEENKSFHGNSISIFVKIEKSIHSRAYLCIFSSHSSESLCRFLPSASMYEAFSVGKQNHTSIHGSYGEYSEPSSQLSKSQMMQAGLS